MISLPHLDLPADAHRQLVEWQKELDAIPLYAERVAAAKDSFSKKNQRTNSTFNIVKATLTQMSQGARRCGYCEDSVGDEVEHIKPKSWFPEDTFVWENYLYSCGPCNTPKNNHFALFDHADNLIRLSRPKKGPILPPPAGDIVLINPRSESPMQFLELDLVNTFFFLPIYSLNTRERKRAEYTIEVLHLNDRDYLVQARRSAFTSYRARLVEYDEKKRSGTPMADLKLLVDALQKAPHQTVWKEMQRKSSNILQLEALFVTNPEARAW